MTHYMHGIPAYGRTYDTEEAVLADWMAGNDFYVYPDVRAGGGYVSIRELPADSVLNIYWRETVDGILPVTREGKVPPDPMDAEVEWWQE